MKRDGPQRADPACSEWEIEQTYRDLDLHQAANSIVYGHSSNRTDIRAFALKGVDFSRVHNILDLGCGFGFSTLGFRGKLRPNTHIVGLDMQETYQRPFLQACESVGAIGEFHASDVAELATYPPSSFDLVFCCYSLYFFPQAVADIARVLNKDGTFIAVTHSQETLAELVRYLPPTLKSLGIRVPELLGIQRLMRVFSSENGEELLYPSFGEVERRIFANQLRFGPGELRHLEVYLAMKKRLLLREVYEASPDSVGAALNQIMVALAAEAATKGVVNFRKDDAAFLCRRPRSAAQERGRPAGPRHCAVCGSRLVERKIERRRRALCMQCGAIAYENPLPVAGAVVRNERGEVLLVRRARHPMKGMWCLPCGFVEKDEKIDAAALRELEEEAHVRGRVVRLLDAVTTQNYFYGSLVMITFEVAILSGSPRPGDDAAEVRFFPPENIPPLAFPGQEQAIQCAQSCG